MASSIDSNATVQPSGDCRHRLDLENGEKLDRCVEKPGDTEKVVPESFKIASLKVDEAEEESYRSQIPFGINRLVLLGMVTVYAVVIGTHFFNWTAWEDCLLEQGAFRSLCHEALRPGEECAEQKKAISAIFPIMNLTFFSFSFVAGLLLDIINPKTCSLVGNTFLVLGWLFLGLASERHLLLYTLGYAFIGCGSDPAFFGILSVANLFPHHGSTVIAIFAAARAGAMVFPVLIYLFQVASPVTFSFSNQALGFAATFLCCWVFAFLFIPSRAYRSPVKGCVKPYEINAAESNPKAEGAGREISDDQINELISHNGSKESASAHTRATTSTTSGGGANTTTTDAGTEDAAGEEGILPPARRLDDNPANIPQSHRRQNDRDTSTSMTEFPIVVPPAQSAESAICISLDRVHTATPLKMSPANKSTPTDSLEDLSILQQLLYLVRTIRSPLFGLLTGVAVLTVVRNSFFLASASSQLGPTTWLLTWANTVALVPCPILGYLADRAGAIVVIQGLNVGTCLAFLALLCAQAATATSTWYEPLGYLTTCLAWLGLSFNLSQFYCYVAEVFPRQHLGKLAGFASVVGGLFGLLVTPMNNFAIQRGDYISMDAVVLAFSVVNTLIISYLTWKIRRTSLPVSI